jgi:hypothetical protein
MEIKFLLHLPSLQIMISLNKTLQTGWGGTDGIDLAQDRDWWRALVNKMLGND